MKKDLLPQDSSALNDFSRELCYVKNESGKYQSALSTGWDVKSDALKITWDDIENRISEAKKLVESGSYSPIYYYMELKLMNLQILSDYTGFWKWQIKRHFKPSIFKQLSEKKLKRYLNAFNISMDELINLTGK